MSSSHRSFVELQQVWQQWTARYLLLSTIARVTAAGDRELAGRLRGSLAQQPAVAPLDALAANAELIGLLRGWRWHTVRAAREAGASWAQVAEVLQTTPAQARAEFLAHIERAERYVWDRADTASYRAVLDDPQPTTVSPPSVPAPSSPSTVADRLDGGSLVDRPQVGGRVGPAVGSAWERRGVRP